MLVPLVIFLALIVPVLIACAIAEVVAPPRPVGERDRCSNVRVLPRPYDWSDDPEIAS